MDGGEEVDGELVISGCDAPEILEPAEHAFDPVAELVGLSVKGVVPFAGRVVGDYRFGAAGDEEGSEAVAIITAIGEQAPGRGQRADEMKSDADFAELAGCHREADRPTLTVDDGVDLGRPPAARATDGFRLGPPFPPAAER